MSRCDGWLVRVRETQIAPIRAGGNSSFSGLAESFGMNKFRKVNSHIPIGHWQLFNNCGLVSCHDLRSDPIHISAQAFAFVAHPLKNCTVSEGINYSLLRKKFKDGHVTCI